MDLLPTESTYIFGRAKHCHLRPVGDIENRSVSREHARIDRVRPNSGSNKGLHVTDISSGKNDIVVDGVASKEFDMGAGDSFYIDKARYVAMTDEMRSARLIITEILGIDQQKAVDDVLIAAVQEPARHILLTGEPGSDQLRLGEMIHYASRRRHRRCQPIDHEPMLDSDNRQKLLDTTFGTLIVPLYQRGRIDPQFAEEALNPALGLRLIICAPTQNKVAGSFSLDSLDHPYEVKIRSLCNRAEEIPHLLDKWLILRHSPLRFSQLDPEFQSAQLKYPWTGNLQELREWCDLLAQLGRFATRYELKTHAPNIDSRLKRIERVKFNMKVKFPLASHKSS